MSEIIDLMNGESILFIGKNMSEFLSVQIELSYYINIIIAKQLD